MCYNFSPWYFVQGPLVSFSTLQWGLLSLAPITQSHLSVVARVAHILYTYIYNSSTTSCYLCTTTLANLTVSVMAYIRSTYLILIRLVSMMCYNSKAMATNDTDYSYHIEAVELV